MPGQVRASLRIASTVPDGVSGNVVMIARNASTSIRRSAPTVSLEYE